MPKMTKTQKKRALESIRLKAFNLVYNDSMSVNDYSAIQRITTKYHNKLK